MLSIIVAMTPKRVIGCGNFIPWHVPSDLRRFRLFTKGHFVVMGKKTFDSIIERNGRPLPNRVSYVFTNHSEEVKGLGGIPITSVTEVPNYNNSVEEVFVIGGADIYKNLLPITSTLNITTIYADVDGDTYFPEINLEEWKEIAHHPREKKPGDEFDSEFHSYSRPHPCL